MPHVDIDARRAYARKHYRANKSVYMQRARAHTGKVRAIVRQALVDHLLVHPCIDCGEADIIVLEFDHRPSSEKSFNIADAVARGYSLETTLAEMAKCDVRCANCHRRETYRRLGHKHKNSGVEQLVARRAHNAKDAGAEPASATISQEHLI